MAALFRPCHLHKLTPNSQAAPKMVVRAANSTPADRKRLPILLFDVMDTIVRDPFYHDVPAFFGMSMKELVQVKHPTVWIEFEEGLIDESELAKRFFKDERPFDLEGLKECMIRGYAYLEGMESLLHRVKENNYEVHAFTNYPIWYKLIEEKLKLSTYLSWTFCSCIIGKSKPSSEAYEAVVRHLGVDPSNCIFIDDRAVNVDAAVDAGMTGLRFRSADALEADLRSLGVDTIITPD